MSSNVPPQADTRSALTGAAELVARYRLWFLGLGTVLVLLGLVAAAHPFFMTAALIDLIGVLLLVGGVLQAALALWTGRGGEFVMHLLSGVLGVVVGILIVLKPGVAAEALTLVFAVYFLIGGTVRLAAAIAPGSPARAWFAATGLVDLVLGVLILNRWPGDSTWLLGLFVAINLVFSGLVWIALALSLRVPQPGEGI